MPLDDTQFETLADETLTDMMDAIDEALGDVLDVDLESGILNIELDSGATYVINKHGPNKQIWMSSPKSGATHYDYDESAGVWRGTREDTVLTDLLADELHKLTGKPFSF